VVVEKRLYESENLIGAEGDDTVGAAGDGDRVNLVAVPSNAKVRLGHVEIRRLSWESLNCASGGTAYGADVLARANTVRVVEMATSSVLGTEMS
jgi:hypothetical protein